MSKPLPRVAVVFDRRGTRLRRAGHHDQRAIRPRSPTAGSSLKCRLLRSSAASERQIERRAHPCQPLGATPQPTWTVSAATALYVLMSADAACGQLYCDATSERPRHPMSRAADRSDRTAFTPAATASGVWSTQNPARWDSTSGHGHVRVTTTGLPAAIASAT